MKIIKDEITLQELKAIAQKSFGSAKMKYQHKSLALGRWNKFSFASQMANIGSEVIRTINWRHKGNPKYSQLAFFRALELLDLTISDKKNISRLKELVRLREVLADYFVFDNIYKSSDQKWQNYFMAFNFLYRNQKD